MARRITEAEVEQLYREYGTPEHVIGHCREVTRVALGIAEHLNRHGYHLDLDLIRGAGLSHDVARVKMISEEAEIVKSHMFYQFNALDKLTECDMVCLGDRLVKYDKYVGVDERFDYIIERAPDRPGVYEHLIERREEMRRLLNQIEDMIGVRIDTLFKQEK